MSLTDYALQYARMGWAVFPCHGIKNYACTCKATGCKSPGKHPAIFNGVLGATTDEGIIRGWFDGKYAGYNIGIATGAKSGFFVVDVDINHDLGKRGDLSLKALENKYGRLPETVESVTGGGGSHILFKCGSGIKSSTSKIGDNIDIRGDGGYIIAEPSLHLSGMGYYWEGSSNPLEGAAIADAPEWLLGLTNGGARPAQPEAVPPPLVAVAGSEWVSLNDGTRADIIRAMAFIPNERRDDWLHVGMIIHALDNSHLGFEMWCEWSKSSKKFDMKDQARVWLSFTNSKEVKLNYQSIFTLAARHGYVDQPEDNQVEDGGGSATVFDGDIQINCTPPVKFVQDVIAKINSTTSSYTDIATTQAALAFCSAAVGRKFKTTHFESAGLFLSTATETLSEVQYAERAVLNLMFECGIGHEARDSRFLHSQDLARAVYDSPNIAYLTSDYTSMVQFATRQPVVGVVLNSLATLYNADRFRTLTRFELEGSDKGNREVIYVHSPVLTMLSSMHSGDIATMLKQSELSRGATGQFIFAYSGRLKHRKNIFGVDISPIISRIASIRGEGSMTPTLQPDHIRCVANDDLTAYYDEIDTICVGDGQASLAYGAKINLRKLITVLAACDDNINCVATKPIVEWAAQYIIGLLRKLAVRISLPSGDDSIREQVVNVIYNAGREGITMARIKDLSRRFRGLKTEEQDDMLSDIVHANIAELIISKSEGRGRPSKRYVIV